MQAHHSQRNIGNLNHSGDFGLRFITIHQVHTDTTEMYGAFGNYKEFENAKVISKAKW